jgi:DNA-binding response OmpR family regulator
MHSTEPSLPSSYQSKGLVLIVEDNQRINEEMCLLLTNAGWRVRSAYDALEFRREVSKEEPMIALLDLNLPGEDGISLCKWLRSISPAVGIVLLTARVMGSERTQGYLAGADIYLTKPTRPEELLAVLQNLSRRTMPNGNEAISMQLGNPWTLNVKSMHLLSPQRDVLSLTPSECKLLMQLSLTPDWCTHEEIIDALFSGGLNDKSDKAKLEVLVSRLRSKLQRIIDLDFQIKTVHGKGYQLTQALKLRDL